MGSHLLMHNFAAQQNLVSATMCEVCKYEYHINRAVIHLEISIWKMEISSFHVIPFRDIWLEIIQMEKSK
jgi:hypothetical protein